MTKAAVSDWGFLRESDGYNREFVKRASANFATAETPKFLMKYLR